MFTHEQFNTSKVEGLGVGFNTKTKSNGVISCYAFIISDEKGFFTSDDIKHTMITEGGLHPNSNLEGVTYIAWMEKRVEGETNFGLTDTIMYANTFPHLHDIITYDKEVYEKAMKSLDEIDKDENPSIIDSICGREGIGDEDKPLIQELYKHMNKAIEMELSLHTRFPNIVKG